MKKKSKIVAYSVVSVWRATRSTVCPRRNGITFFLYCPGEYRAFVRADGTQGERCMRRLDTYGVRHTNPAKVLLS